MAQKQLTKISTGVTSSDHSSKITIEMSSLGATRTTNSTANGQMSISPIRNENEQQQQQQQQQQQIDRKKSRNIMEWKTSHVCEFMQEILGGRHQELIQTIQKHHVCGVDLVEMTEQNLIELGIPTMHERKQVLRAIRQSRNDPQSTYGKFKVRMFNPSTHKYQEVILKVSDNETKVKHILKQAFQVFTKAKCDISDFCLAKISFHSKTKTILSNETIFLSLLHENAGSLDLFEICSGGDFVTQTSTILNGSIQTISAESPSLHLPKTDSSSLEQILQSPQEEPTITESLIEDASLFDKSKFILPSFIDQQPAVMGQVDMAEFKNINKKQISRTTSQEGANKIKARIGSANIQQVLKEKLNLKRVQHRNQNASQLNSHGSNEQQNTNNIQNAKEKVIQKVMINNCSQPYVKNVPPQFAKQRQNSLTSQEKFLGTSLNLVSQQRTIDLNTRQNDSNKQLRILPTNQKQVHVANVNISQPLVPTVSDTRPKKTQINLNKTPIGSQLTSSQIGINNDKHKLLPKQNMRTGMNMFQTMNERPQNKIQHHRNSSKSSCLIPPSDQTTERAKPILLNHPRVQKSKSGSRQNKPYIDYNKIPDDEEQNILQCSLDVQNTIQTVADREKFKHQMEQPLHGDLNQILSDFLNEQKINVNLQQNLVQKVQRPKESQQNNKNESQSRQQQCQQLLEQDSLESQAFEEEFNMVQQCNRYDPLECQKIQAEQENYSRQQQQNQMNQKVFKQIQTKSINTFQAALQNQKKPSINILSKNQVNNTQIRRQNYVNSYQTNYEINQLPANNKIKSNDLCMMYGTFDNTLAQKSQLDGSSQKIERGSSVGEQFYTIDNTNKENINNHQRVMDFAPIQNQRQQILVRRQQQENYGIDHQQHPVLAQQKSIIIGGPSHIKIKNIGLKIRANGLENIQQSQGLQRNNTMGDSRLRSNSNNTRQQVNNRYGKSNDDGVMIEQNIEEINML